MDSEQNNSSNRKYEILYSASKLEIEELLKHKNEMVAMKDKIIAKHKNEIKDLEKENENLKENLEENSKEINKLQREIIEINKIRSESLGNLESVEKELDDYKTKWKKVDLTKQMENSNLDLEKVKKCIFVYEKENKTLSDKVIHLEEYLKQIESESTILKQQYEKQKEFDNKSWFFHRWFSKSNRIENKMANYDEEKKQQSFNKMVTAYNREKEKLLLETDISADRILQLEQDNEKMKKHCTILREKILKHKNELDGLHKEKIFQDLQIANNPINNIQDNMEDKTTMLNELQLKLKEQHLEFEKYKETLKREIESLKKEKNFKEMEYDQLLIKKETQQEYIEKLQEEANHRLSFVEATITEKYDSKSFQNEIDISNENSRLNNTFPNDQYSATCPNCGKDIPGIELEIHFNECLEKFN